MPTLPLDLIGIASHYIGECYDIGKLFLDFEVKHTPSVTQFVSTQLFVDNVMIDESILILLAYDKFWDAEILLRIVFEGSLLKFSSLPDDKISLVGFSGF